MEEVNKNISRIGYGKTYDSSWWYTVDALGCIGGQSSPEWIAHFRRYIDGCAPAGDKVFVEFRNGNTLTFDKTGFAGDSSYSTKNGESTMNYAVVSMNLGDTSNAPSVIKSSANLDEVKAFVEAKVAGLRASLQTKNFFSLVVLDMRTGTVLLSVADAPPTLTWEGVER